MRAKIAVLGRRLRAGSSGPRHAFSRPGHNRSESGAALIEMALTLTLLVMLLVGVVTSAVAFGRDNSIQNAAREASRYGATLPEGGSPAWFQDVSAVARAAATGDLEATVPNAQVCVAFITKDDVASHVIDDGVTTPLIIVPDERCPGFDDGRSGNNESRVNVVTQRDTTINAILFSTDVTLQAEASARYERDTP